MWKEKLIKAFPEGFDYDTMLKAMINRAKKPQETMTEYYYEKTLMLSRLGISGKNAVCLKCEIEDTCFIFKVLKIIQCLFFNI